MGHKGVKYSNKFHVAFFFLNLDYLLKVRDDDHVLLLKAAGTGLNPRIIISFT